jgi:hypothetical protein|tara:strand:- start:991 stop:1326 length:336 start_codon:yes stop_codon:yes gene_type:complete
MANTFKTKTFDGSSANADTFMTVYTVPSATTAVVLGMTLANITTSSIEVTIFLTNDDGNNVNIAKLAQIPAKSSLEVMSGNKYVLETSDILKVKSATANSLDTTLSVMEIT